MSADGHISHPADPSSEASRTDRILRGTSMAGFLGFLGFLEHLHPLHGLFEVAQLFYVFFLLFLVPIVAVVARGVWNRLSSAGGPSRTQETDSPSDEDDPRYWITMGYEPSPLKTAQAVAFILHPNVLVRGLFQLAGGLGAIVRHGGRLPGPETHDSPVTYSPPFEGEWTVVNGSPDSRYSHSWVPVRQRYAYDFVVTDDAGSTHDGSGGLGSFYCFDEPILAPADGTVVRVRDGHRDHHRTSGWIDPLQYRLAGNYVLIEHGDGEYSFLAHLRKGSVCVSPGERVERGQEVGRCGHSGNSSEPHLHFHLQDHRLPYLGAGLPVQFAGRTTHPDTEATEGDRVWAHCGQTLTPQPG